MPLTNSLKVDSEFEIIPLIQDSQLFTALFERYQFEQSEPFFTDICGPDPMMGEEDFWEYCSSEDSASWIITKKNSQQILGSVHLIDIQPELSLANVDFFIFRETPDAVTTLQQVLLEIEATLLKQYKISRVQAMIRENDTVKTDLLASAGYNKEGVLREQFFHRGTYWNLHIYAKICEERNVP